MISALTSAELFKVYKEMTNMYLNASSCGIPREMEYVSELVIHLLQDEDCPISEIYEEEKIIDSEKELNLTRKRNLIINEWNWKRLRSMFIQRNYQSLIDEIDKEYGDKFFIWNYNNEALDSDLHCLRCALLKCFSLEKLKRFGDLMKFSSTFLQHLKQSSNNELNKTRKRILLCFQSKVLALQGVTFQLNGMIEISTECYIQAVTTSLSDVPWVLQILIGTHRLTLSQEIELIDGLSRFPSSSLNTSILEPFCYFLFHWIWIDDNDDPFLIPSIPASVRQSIEFWEVSANRLLDCGSIKSAHQICYKIVGSGNNYFLHWRLLRIYLETLFYNYDSGESETLHSIATTLQSDWKDRPESHFASALVFMSEGSYLGAVNELDAGLEISVLFNNLAQTEMELYLLLYKIVCLFQFGLVSKAQETVELLQLKYPNSPFTKLFSKRLQLANAAHLTSYTCPRCPDAVSMTTSDKLKSPLLYRNPFHNEILGDTALCHERFDIASNYYLSAWESLSDDHFIVDRFSQFPGHQLITTHYINYALIRLTLKLTLVLSKLRQFEEAQKILDAGIERLNLSLGASNLQWSEFFLIFATSDANIFQLFFSLPSIRDDAHPANLLHNRLKQIGELLRCLAKSVVDSPNSLDFSIFQKTTTFV